MRSDIKETDYTTFFRYYHDRMDRRESYIHYPCSKDKHRLKRKFLKIPYINSTVITASSESTITCTSLGCSKLKMSVSNVSDKLELAL